MDKSVLFLGTGNTLYYPSGAATTSIKAFRAYFQVNLGGASSVKSFVLNFGEDDDATGIISIESAKQTNGNDAEWYDLNGRRLGSKPTQKGIYINNGHKLIIK